MDPVRPVGVGGVPVILSSPSFWSFDGTSPEWTQPEAKDSQQV